MDSKASEAGEPSVCCGGIESVQKKLKFNIFWDIYKVLYIKSSTMSKGKKDLPIMNQEHLCQLRHQSSQSSTPRFYQIEKFFLFPQMSALSYTVS